jgi:2Fe-2S ferredoxin
MAAKYSATFIQPDGQSQTVPIAEGWSLMEGAVKQLVPGIDADCGGACACATCQVYIESPWAGNLPPKSEMEETMLDFAPDVRPESRLSCQLRMTRELDGIVLRLPRTQRA